MDQYETPAMSPQERMRLRAAATAAGSTYPGPVGELLAREIWAWEEFGFRYGSDGLMHRVVDDVLGQDGATRTDTR